MTTFIIVIVVRLFLLLATFMVGNYFITIMNEPSDVAFLSGSMGTLAAVILVLVQVYFLGCFVAEYLDREVTKEKE